MELQVDLTPAGTIVTRRRIVFRAAAAIGILAVSGTLTAEGPQQSMQQVPASDANGKRTSLRQQVELKAASDRVYDALLDAKQFASFTGQPAKLDPIPGGAFSLFGGHIEGRNVELVPKQRIVQAWRPASWEAGDFSIVRFDLKANGSATTVVLNHKGFPEGDFDHLAAGWNTHYWEPLKKFLG